MVSGFIGTIKDGVNEYELKMRAIQTIIEPTQSRRGPHSARLRPLWPS
uniref:Uncharacterized protein n=1 Tax=Siphoviridae sp. ctxOE3 TaxID=2826519 RepID=A0A8S5NFW2_9CAUD|nr:MAG TPA: hypothetical protein [Siphoviridae sp. ctxOE3]